MPHTCHQSRARQAMALLTRHHPHFYKCMPDTCSHLDAMQAMAQLTWHCPCFYKCMPDTCHQPRAMQVVALLTRHHSYYHKHKSSKECAEALSMAVQPCELRGQAPAWASCHRLRRSRWARCGPSRRRSRRRGRRRPGRRWRGSACCDCGAPCTWSAG